MSLVKDLNVMYYKNHIYKNGIKDKYIWLYDISKYMVKL